MQKLLINLALLFLYSAGMIASLGVLIVAIKWVF